MICPICNNELTESNIHGIVIDECITCNAIWFDAGELETYLSERIKDNGKDISIISRFDAIASDLDGSCPKCETEKMRYGKVGNLSLSKCEKCNGILMEKNQLQSGRGSACDPLIESLLIQALGETVLNLLDGQ